MLLLFISQINIAEKELETIKVILYLYGGVVSVMLSGAKISGIERSVDSGPDSESFVAPSLIFVGVKKATKVLWMAGMTSCFPTIITSDIALVKKNFAISAEARKDLEIGMSVLGFHLGGDYISHNKSFRVALLEKYFKNPNREEFMGMHKAFHSRSKITAQLSSCCAAYPSVDA